MFLRALLSRNRKLLNAVAMCIFARVDPSGITFSHYWRRNFFVLLLHTAPAAGLQSWLGSAFLIKFLSNITLLILATG